MISSAPREKIRTVSTRSNLRWAGATWIVFLVLLSLQPMRLRPIARGTHGHLFVHLVLFGSAAVLPLLLSENRVAESVRALGILCLAAAIEIAQSRIYHHKTEWSDLEFDFIGVLTVFVAIRFWRIRTALRANGKPLSLP
jgi:hypothetical protein